MGSKERSTRRGTPQLNDTEPRRPDEAFNFRLLLIDGALFMWGGAFADASTVLPVYVSTLTASSVLIGLAPAIRNGGWYLPQLLVASFAARLRRKMPVSILGMIVHRASYLLIAASVFLLAARSPALALGAFFLFLTTLSLGDGIGGVPYVDIVGKTIAATRRGRLFGYMQAVGSVLAFGSGFIIRAILGAPRPGYPNNYGFIFLIGAVVSLGSMVAFSLVREPPGESRAEHANFLDYLRLMPRYWRESPTFARMVLVRLACNTIYLTVPFYAVYARAAIGLPAGTVGAFVSVQMAGTLVGSVVMGHVADRLGNRAVIRASAASAFLAPTTALAAAIAVAASRPALARPLMFLPFLFIGFYFSAAWIGFVNYLIEIVPREMRPTYTGFMNTVMAMTSALAVVGGVVVQLFGYPAAFALNLVSTGVAVYLSLGMVEPRFGRQSAPRGGMSDG